MSSYVCPVLFQCVRIVFLLRLFRPLDNYLFLFSLLSSSRCKRIKQASIRAKRIRALDLYFRFLKSNIASLISNFFECGSPSSVANNLSRSVFLQYFKALIVASFRSTGGRSKNVIGTDGGCVHPYFPHAS